MIGIEALVSLLAGLSREDLERWIENEWVRPEPGEEGYAFGEIDVARVRLILELRDEMQINEEALPVVLSLLDQLYDQRRRLRELCDALRSSESEEVRRELARHLGRREE